MDLTIILYFWTVVLTVITILMWTKLEIVSERMLQQFDYQRMVNKNLDEAILDFKKLYREHHRIPIPEELNSEELFYNTMMDLQEVTDDEYASDIEDLQELSVPRTKL